MIIMTINNCNDVKKKIGNGDETKRKENKS